ncbi:DUF2061 domain-containing protein [Massilia sp. Dwa41.01b]|uniref:DUF2061 domain-containing protein n=1 Tax=unclassified Massilia TaxID=2609279 RepID=UPI001601F33B|nr:MULTISPECIES: DUF2061 domain-containing protein [unclassified Massilia]QNA87806.1 DUF2061 domain-containing protein [Massilia sp. Dwa41.01b]QNA98707.1 DUF2061 domain-containing protein [Massilia sp. Se16.2.3]
MMTAAKRLSQVAAHMGIGYALAYAMTGSPIVGGLAMLIEPAVNVMLLPWHEAAWAKWRRLAGAAGAQVAAVAAEKLSQTAFHAAIAFGVMFIATGSFAMGGIAAVVEPICNVLILPLHDRLWLHFERAILDNGRLQGG